jgi:hypothetical protein
VRPPRGVDARLHRRRLPLRRMTPPLAPSIAPPHGESSHDFRTPPPKYKNNNFKFHASPKARDTTPREREIAWSRWWPKSTTPRWSPSPSRRPWPM